MFTFYATTFAEKCNHQLVVATTGAFTLTSVCVCVCVCVCVRTCVRTCTCVRVWRRACMWGGGLLNDVILCILFTGADQGFLRPNYFIFIGYFKTGGGEGVQAPPPPNLLRIRHCFSTAIISLRKRELVVFFGCILVVVRVPVTCVNSLQCRGPVGLWI